MHLAFTTTKLEVFFIFNSSVQNTLDFAVQFCCLYSLFVSVIDGVVEASSFELTTKLIQIRNFMPTNWSIMNSGVRQNDCHIRKTF